VSDAAVVGSPPVPQAGSTFRPDIEGLRGVAIALVLLFHAGLPVPGGFVGVDVFFVISGFLITDLLLREHRRAGRVSFARFYARRVRRLLPAAAVVIAVTLLVAVVVVGPLDRPGVTLDGASAALSIANVRFALAEGDYFTAITQPSPFLHFWSLAVEEQFYLVWPALLFLVARGGRIRVSAVLVIVLVASFAANLVLTDTAISWAFYSLPARAWQLAAGGLLAVGAASLDEVRQWPLALAGWVGGIALVAFALVLPADVPYPGIRAVAPTASAIALIAAGRVARGPGLLLATRPLRFLGRISYSLYLWHWPILALVPVAVGADLALGWRLALAAAAIVVATASWKFIEEPFRRGRLAATPPRRVLPAGVAAMLALVVVATGLDIGSARAIDEIGGAGPVPSAPATGEEPAGSWVLAEASPSPAGSAASAAPTILLPPPTVRPEPTPPPVAWDQIPDAAAAAPIPVPAGVRPALAKAREDTERVWRDNCGAQVPVITPPACVYGDPNGSLTVALVGDSHAAQWFPAFELVAKANHWRLLPYLKLSCPFIEMPVENYPLKREYTECSAWRDEVIRILPRMHPDIVVVGMSHRGIFPWYTADQPVARQGDAIGQALLRLPGRVLLLVDTPRTNTDIPGCIAVHPTDVRPCAIPRSAFQDTFGVRERIAAAIAGAGTLDLISSVCPALPCQVIRDGMIVYRDNHHLTATFSASLAPVLDAALRPYVDALSRRPTP
jgi:peptidoglycan/LPS O-acetylase OafA/YrhL